MPAPQFVPTISSMLVVFALAAAAPALSAEPPKTSTESTPKPAKEAKPKEKVVCRTEEIAGSLIPKRVCETKKQLDAQRQAVDDLVSERREIGATRTEALGLVPGN